MLKFFLKSFALIVVLFFGVLLGMQQANEGLIKMKGYKDHSFTGAFDIEMKESGDVEAAVLGEKLTSHDLKEKQEKLAEMKAFNFFSSLAGKLGTIITEFFQKMFQYIINFVEKMISLLS